MKTQTVDRWIEDYARVSRANHGLVERLALVLARFHEQGVEVLLLKGADLLPHLYGAWGLRPMADADLLVRETDLPLIDRLLREAGYSLQISGSPVYGDPAGTLALDLITEVWYTDDTDAIRRRAVSRRLNGVPVRVMNRNDLLLYLALYFVLHRGCLTLASARDLALITRREPLDWAFILREAAHCRVTTPLHHALSQAARTGALVPSEVLDRLAPRGVAERGLALFLRRLVTDRRVDGLGHFLLFMARPGRDKWRWLWRSFAPPAAFLRYRYGQRGAARPWWTRLTRAVMLTIQAQRLAIRILCLLVRGTERRS